MLVTLLYVSFPVALEKLSCNIVHTINGDLARMLCTTQQTSHNITRLQVPSAQLPRLHFVQTLLLPQSGGKTNLLRVRNFPRETRHGGVGDSSRDVTC